MPPGRQILLQLIATITTFGLVWIFSWWQHTSWHWGFFCLLTGTTALLLARHLQQPWWWQLIHFLFSPLAWVAFHLSISPGYYLAGLLVLLLIFRGAPSERVPLYFSNRQTSQYLSQFLPPNLSLIDLGAGIGSMLHPLAAQRPDLHLAGIENAPIPWLIGRLRTLYTPDIHWHWGSLWQHSLKPYDAVYCFLSPAPMAALWNKARREMAPGSLFISKEFPVPDDSIIPLEHPEQNAGESLYIYRIPEPDRAP